MNEKTGIASSRQQVATIMRSKAEPQLTCFVFFLALAVVFSFSILASPDDVSAASCAQKIRACDAKIGKLENQQLKLGKKALKLVQQRSKIRHDYAPVQSALNEIKTMQSMLRDSKAELDAAARASGGRVSYQSNGRAMGIISASGSSGGSAKVQLDIYNTQFDKYQPKLKHETKLNKKARKIQKKLHKINEAIARVDKKSASIEKKIEAQKKKCRKLHHDCHSKPEHAAKTALPTNAFGGYPDGSKTNSSAGYGGYDNGDNAVSSGTRIIQGGFRDQGDSAVIEDDDSRVKPEHAAKTALPTNAFGGYPDGSKTNSNAGYGGYDNGDNAVSSGARIIQGGFRDQGDSAVIEDDNFKVSSRSSLKADGVCSSAANDITAPFIFENHQTDNAVKDTTKAVSGLAMGVLGGMINKGVFNSIGTGDQGGAQMVNAPKVPMYAFSNGATTVKVGGWVYKPRSKKKKPEIRIAQRIKDSPDKGAPHMMILQNNRDGRFLKPIGYMIFELWRHWKLTITITRDTWVNGEHTSHSVSKESTQWDELAERYQRIMEAPGIWEQFGLAPFGKLKGVIAQFKLPENFNPADWTLVKHDTAKAMVNGKEVIKTVPFVLSLGQGEKNRLTFQASPDGKTGYQREHGCQSLDEIMNAALGMFVPDYLKGKAQKKPSQYKMKKTKLNAAHWARILILQPGPTDKWLKNYHKLSQSMQVDGAVAMADIMLRLVTGTGIAAWDPGQWNKDFIRLDKHVRNLAITAANRWKHGISTQQLDSISRSYSKLSPRLQQVFQREFIYTLATNLFLDLRLPEPVMLKPVRGASGGASIR